MLKFTLLIVALIALVQPSIQIICYKCKSANYVSSVSEFNTASYEICGDDQNKWPTTHTSDLSYERCKKIVENVKHNNKDEILVIRTIGTDNMKLNETIFKEYSCKEDYCNSAVTTHATVFLAFLSVITTTAITTYF